MSKAAARRWFAARAGRQVTTRQVKPSGMTWEPGERTVSVSGNVIRLDNSRVDITPDHAVLAVTDSHVRIEWLDSDGVRIHVTTYSDVAEPGNDD